jgi:hypothetical protein
MDMSSLFNENDDTDSMITSDLIVSHLDSDEDKLGASDLLTSQNIDENNNGACDSDYDQTNSQIKDLHYLIRYHMDLDETLVYNIDDVEPTLQSTEKITRRPAYLTMFMNNINNIHEMLCKYILHTCNYKCVY